MAEEVLWQAAAPVFEPIGGTSPAHGSFMRDFQPIPAKASSIVSSHTSRLQSVVAIPVCDERERIVACLDALAGQEDVDRAALGLLLFLNNCTDGTRDLVEAWVPGSPCPVRIIERNSDTASAGWARREAMDAAVGWLEEVPATGGILLTTDADSRVPADWVARNAAALGAGADAVAGRIAFDLADSAMLSERLRRRQTLELDYETLLAEIEARLDPCRGNPWPCHWTKSGASIAVSLDAYRRVGGMPPLPSGEDHAFIDLVREHGLVVRHAPDIVVTTSGRLEGRARGGAADTLKHRSADLDGPCDARLEPLMSFVVRTLRRRFGDGASVARRSRPLRPTQLPRQIRRARLLLRWLRALEARRAGSRPSGSRLPNRPPEPLSTP